MDFWQQRGARLIVTGLRGLVPGGTWWYQVFLTVFGLTGMSAHILGMITSARGQQDAAIAWFISGTVLWVGAFVILIFFIGPVSKARHRR